MSSLPYGFMPLTFGAESEEERRRRMGYIHNPPGAESTPDPSDEPPGSLKAKAPPPDPADSDQWPGYGGKKGPPAYDPDDATDWASRGKAGQDPRVQVEFNYGNFGPPGNSVPPSDRTRFQYDAGEQPQMMPGQGQGHLAPAAPPQGGLKPRPLIPEEAIPFTKADDLSLQKLQQGMAQVQSELADDILAEPEAADLRGQIMTKMQPLLQKKQRHEAQQKQQAVQQQMQDQALQFSMGHVNAVRQAQSFGERVATFTHPFTGQPAFFTQNGKGEFMPIEFPEPKEQPAQQSLDFFPNPAQMGVIAQNPDGPGPDVMGNLRGAMERFGQNPGQDGPLQGTPDVLGGLRGAMDRFGQEADPNTDEWRAARVQEKVQRNHEEGEALPAPGQGAVPGDGPEMAPMEPNAIGPEGPEAMSGTGAGRLAPADPDFEAGFKRAIQDGWLPAPESRAVPSGPEPESPEPMPTNGQGGLAPPAPPEPRINPLTGRPAGESGRVMVAPSSPNPSFWRGQQAMQRRDAQSRQRQALAEQVRQAGLGNEAAEAIEDGLLTDNDLRAAQRQARQSVPAPQMTGNPRIDVPAANDYRRNLFDVQQKTLGWIVQNRMARRAESGRGELQEQRQQHALERISFRDDLYKQAQAGQFANREDFLKTAHQYKLSELEVAHGLRMVEMGERHKQAEVKKERAINYGRAYDMARENFKARGEMPTAEQLEEEAGKIVGWLEGRKAMETPRPGGAKTFDAGHFTISGITPTGESATRAKVGGRMAPDAQVERFGGLMEKLLGPQQSEPTPVPSPETMKGPSSIGHERAAQLLPLAEETLDNMPFFKRYFTDDAAHLVDIRKHLRNAAEGKRPLTLQERKNVESHLRDLEDRDLANKLRLVGE